MKFARSHSFSNVRVEEGPAPRIGRGEALARVRVCGVCTGEVMPWYVNRKCPTVLGHEPVGEIVKIGPGLKGRWKIGDRIFFHHHTSCGTCVDCRRGHPTLCPEFHRTRLEPGGFSEFVKIPALNLKKDTLKLPAGVSDEEGVFIEPLACCVHAFRRAPVRKGDTVLVIGLGVMGLLNLQVARAMGAKKILGCDLRADRRRLARRYDANAAIPPDPASLRRITKGRGAEIVIVGPPSPSALKFAAKSAAPGATVVLFAPLPPGSKAGVDFHDLYFREQSIVTSYSCGASDTREALRLLARKKIKTAGLITHRFGLDGVGKALRKMWKGEGNILKAAIYP
ncbi:alcohol dehydrogenase catalytic domain-containing protein [bacterium]|nr:alcohol dehydrogenase catalytic domain-containing protein [bacterium]